MAARNNAISATRRSRRRPPPPPRVGINAPAEGGGGKLAMPRGGGRGVGGGEGIRWVVAGGGIALEVVRLRGHVDRRSVERCYTSVWAERA